MKPENLVHLRVWGDFACSTRPKMKVPQPGESVWKKTIAEKMSDAKVTVMGQQISIHEKTGPGEPAGSLLSFKIPIAMAPGAAS